MLASVLGLGLALMLAIGLARRITRPLRRLTVAAGEIGDELPRMVERMQTPGEGPGVVVEPIAVESRDEIGQLAVAFNTVNDVTVQVAKEQAALRSSIAEMFVNVARRNQVLLGRQLSQLDRMESGEEDPDVLQHLFTPRPPGDPDAAQRREPAGARRHRLEPTAAHRPAAVGRDPHRGR